MALHSNHRSTLVPLQVEAAVYDLYAVVNHQGDTPISGHYTASCLVDDGWHLFDDAHVEPLAAHQVVTKEAYVLFYK